MNNMITTEYLRNLLVSLLFSALILTFPVSARPATFQQDFKVTWADSHFKLVEGGKAIQLKLDQTSGTYYKGFGLVGYFFLRNKYICSITNMIDFLFVFGASCRMWVCLKI